MYIYIAIQIYSSAAPLLYPYMILLYTIYKHSYFECYTYRRLFCILGNFECVSFWGLFSMPQDSPVVLNPRVIEGCFEYIQNWYVILNPTFFTSNKDTPATILMQNNVSRETFWCKSAWFTRVKSEKFSDLIQFRMSLWFKSMS